MKNQSKILIVDDKPQNLLALEKILAKLDVQIIRAESGNDALKASLEHEFALALLDVQMPEMDGYELAEFLRGEKKTCDLPIIFISAVYSDYYYVFKGYDAGGVDYLIKPFQAKILINKVNIFLQLHRQKMNLIRMIEIEKSKNYLENILMSTADLVMVVSPAGRIDVVNETTLSVLGYRRDEFIGKDVSKIFEQNQYDDWSKRLMKESGESKNVLKAVVHGIEGMILTALDKWIPVLFSLSSLVGEDNEDLGVVLVATDITEQKFAEQKIKQLNLELEKRVLDRTRELKSINRELEAFAYSVSHDLRTPLRSIRGFSQVLMEDHLDQLNDQGRDYLNRVDRAAHRMGQLIDDLLQLSRLARSNMNFCSINLSRMAQTIAQNLQQDDPDRKADFQIQEDITGYGDKRLLQIVLENLMGNAWKFSANSSLTIIKMGVQKKEDSMIYFIRDNGAGFDMRYSQKMFDVFQRLHLAKEFPGTGIGLAIVNRILQRHGGHIWSEGKPGKGAIFYFSLTNHREEPHAE